MPVAPWPLRIQQHWMFDQIAVWPLITCVQDEFFRVHSTPADGHATAGSFARIAEKGIMANVNENPSLLESFGSPTTAKTVPLAQPSVWGRPKPAAAAPIHPQVRHASAHTWH